MEIPVNDMAYIILGLWGSLSVYLLFEVFYESANITIERKFALFGIYSIITDISYLVLNIPILTISINIICLLFIAYQYKKDIKKSIMLVLIVYLFMGSIEILALSLIYYKEFFTTSSNALAPLEYKFITGLIAFICVVLMKNFKIAKENNQIHYNQWITMVIISMISIYSVIMLISHGRIGLSLRTLTIGGLIILNISIIYFYTSVTNDAKKRLKLALYEKEIVYYKNQFKILEQSRILDKAMHHDLNNMLIGVKSVIADGKAEDVVKYIENFKNNYKSKDEFVKTGNIIVDSILNYKLARAKDNDINFETKIKIPKDLKLDVADISVVLGNLLDNAIEALTKVPKKKRTIIVEVEYKMKRLFIKIENAYDGCIKIKNNEILTLKENVQNHGLGISSVKKIAKKYGGYMRIEYNDKWFIVKVIIGENQP